MIILMADNDPFFLATRSVYLEQAGHKVIRARNPQEAEYALRHLYLHAAVMDVRLTDDDDGTDESGLALVRHPDFRDIPKLVLTGFATVKQANQAMELDEHGRAGAFGYIEKRWPAEEMVSRVEGLQSRLRINANLRIHADARALLDVANLAHLIPLPPSAPVLEDQPPADYGREFEDLIRRVFFEYGQITLQHLLWRRDERFALVILAYKPGSERSQDSAYILTCGPVDAIRAEAERYHRLAPASVRPDHGPLFETTTTTHFGVNARRLALGELEGARPLRKYFGDATRAQIGEVLDKLDTTLLQKWHSHMRVEAPKNLVAIVEDTLACPQQEASAALQARIATVAAQTKTHGLGDLEVLEQELRLTLPRLQPVELPNPARCLAGAPLLSATRSVQYSTVIGALDGESALVAPPDRIWLTDFSGLKNGPVVADYAALEVEIKYDSTDCADALERYELEKALVEARQLEANFNASVPAALDKTLSAVRRVRKLAAKACGADPQPYFAALFAATTNRLLQIDPNVLLTPAEVARLLHATLSLALICRRMLESATTLDLTGGLRLLPNRREAIVGAKSVPLTPHEYQLLRFLWDKNDEVSSREAVERAVFGDIRVGTDSARLGVLVKRLRSKIEPDPEKPIYLITVRGHGLRLCPGGQPAIPDADTPTET